MIRNLFISFIAGSSLPAFIILFLIVIQLFERKEAIYNYYNYSIMAPIFLGLGAVFAKLLSIYTLLTLRQSYFIISILSSIFVMINISRDGGAYKFETQQRWYFQYFLILLGHLFIFNIIIYNIDNYLTKCI